MVMRSAVVVAMRIGPFWDKARAICDHVLMGCQWLAIAFANGRSFSSVAGMSSGLSA